MRTCQVLAMYLVEVVAGARGNVVSFVAGDVAKWAEAKMRPTRSMVFKIVHMCEALLKAGYLTKMGKKYILSKNTQLWEKAKLRDVEGICEIVEGALVSYSKVVK
ncbi:MAG: DNA-binding protein [Pyrobaculum sp.]